MRLATLLTSIVFVKLTNVIVEVHCSANITADPAVVECNSNVTVTCYTAPNTDTMSWYRNGSLIAYCLSGYCFDLKTLPRYEATFDQVAGEFNVVITPAIAEDSIVQFGCEDGVSSIIFFLSVTDDYGIEVTWTEMSSNITKLESVTGCINSSVEARFTWNLKNVKNTTDVKALTVERNEYAEGTICLSDENCGGPGKQKHISSLTITEDNDQENAYYVEVIVSYVGYPGYTKVKNISDRTFKVIESPTSSTYSLTTRTITETKDASASTTTTAPTTLSPSAASSSSTAFSVNTTVTQVSSSTNLAKTTSPKSSAVKDTITTTAAPTKLSSSATSSSSSTTATAITASSINTTVAQESSSTNFAKTTSRKSSAVKEYTITTIAVVSSISVFMVVSVTFILLYVNGRRWFRRRKRNRRQMGHFHRTRAEIRPDSELSIIRM